MGTTCWTTCPLRRKTWVTTIPWIFPHITVWGSCFSLGSRRSPPSAAAAPLTHSLTHTHSHSLTHSFTHCTDSFLAAFGVAGAVHRASWRSCGARGRRWGRGCLWRGRRSTQSLLEELRRAWAPLGPRLPFAWQAQYTEPPGGAAARVGAAGAAAAFCVAGAVHRASQKRNMEKMNLVIERFILWMTLMNI